MRNYETRFENCANSCPPIENSYVESTCSVLKSSRLSKYSIYLRDSRREIPSPLIRSIPIRFPSYVHLNRSSSNKLRDRVPEAPQPRATVQIAALINPTLRSKGIIRVNSFYECVPSCFTSERPAARRTAGCLSAENVAVTEA